MGRAPCCDKEGLKRGPWTPEEDKILVDYIQNHGHGSWRSLPKLAGLLRCGKSCRLRWTNYLRPDIKRGPFTQNEQKSIIQLHAIVGNKWSTIAAQLPGRTDNEIKNYWNTHLKKRLLKAGIDPDTSAPTTAASSPLSLTGTPSSPTSATPLCSATRHMTQWESARLEAEARLSKESLLFSSTWSSLATTATATSTTQPEQATPKQTADIFLRIWNSEIGEAFRSKEAVCSSSSSRLFTVKEDDETGTGVTGASTTERGEDLECKNSTDGFGGSDSWSSNEAAEESYQLYLDFAAGEDMVSLFQSNLSSMSLFGGDLGEMMLTDPSLV